MKTWRSCFGRHLRGSIFSLERNCQNFMNSGWWKINVNIADFQNIQNTNLRTTLKMLTLLPVAVSSIIQVRKTVIVAMFQRPSAVCVADILHVLLWGPKQWQTNLESGSPPPKRRDVMRWLLTLSAEVMFQRWCHMSPPGVEYRLKNQFLSRLNLDGVMASIDCLWHLAWGTRRSCWFMFQWCVTPFWPDQCD